MKKTPKVTVVIPCFNLGGFIDEAVDSVLAQTFDDYEIIIVNDGSTDAATNAKLAHYDRPRTVVYTTENQRLPRARNFGIEKGRGQYVCCLDADDLFAPTYLE